MKCRSPSNKNLLELFISVASLIDLVTPIDKLKDSEYSNESGVIGDDADTILALSDHIGSSYLKYEGVTRPRIQISELPIIKSNFAGKKSMDVDKSDIDDITGRRRNSFIQSYKVGTYTYKGEHCDEVFAKKFLTLDIVGIQGVTDPKKHDLLADAMKFTHAYTVSLSPAQTRGCGLVVASKHPVVRAVWTDLFGVDSVAGKKPVGGIMGCKIELGEGKYFWVFSYQFDERILRAAGIELPSALPPDIAAQVAAGADVEALEKSLGARKLNELNRFIGIVLADEPDINKCGIVILGDFGVKNFSIDVEPMMSEGIAQMMAGEIGRDINDADTDSIGLRCDDVLAKYVKPKGYPNKYLGFLLSEISSPYTRSLFLTKLIAKSVRMQTVKTLSRNFTVNLNMSQLVAKEKSILVEYVNLIINSWNMKTGEINHAYRPEFWKAELKDKLSISNYLHPEERSYEYDMRRVLQPYPIIAALCDALHVTLKLESRLRIIDGLISGITEDDVVEIALPALRVFPKAPKLKMTSEFLSVLTILNARDMCSEAILGLPDLGFSQNIPYTTFHVLALNRLPEGPGGKGFSALKSASSSSLLSVNPLLATGSTPTPMTPETAPRNGQNAQKGPALLRSSDIEKFFIVEDNTHFGIAATLSFKV